MHYARQRLELAIERHGAEHHDRTGHTIAPIRLDLSRLSATPGVDRSKMLARKLVMAASGLT